MSDKKKGAMYPLKVLGNLIGWIVIFGVVKWAIQKRFSQRNNRR